LSIAYHTDADGDYSIYKIRLSDSNIQAVTGTGSAERYPSWSPDGAYIAFEQDLATGGTIVEISYVPMSGGQWVGVSDVTDGIYDRFPTWSPDSRRIVYTHWENAQADIISERVR